MNITIDELLTHGFKNIGVNSRGFEFYVRVNESDGGLVLHKVKNGESLGAEFFEIETVKILSEILK